MLPRSTEITPQVEANATDGMRRGSSAENRERFVSFVGMNFVLNRNMRFKILAVLGSEPPGPLPGKLPSQCAELWRLQIVGDPATERTQTVYLDVH